MANYNESSLQADIPWSRAIILAAIGTLIFLLLQVMPAIYNEAAGKGLSAVISKGQAEEAAKAFVHAHYGEQATRAHVVYQADKLLPGYLDKAKKMDEFTAQYDKDYPFEMYQAEVYAAHPEGNRLYFIYVHMFTGEVVAWNWHQEPGDSQGLLPGAEAEEAALAFAASRGYHREELVVKGAERDGTIRIGVQGAAIGEATLDLLVRIAEIGGKPAAVGFKPDFQVPASYKDYVASQDKLAERLSLFGYLLLSAVLGILAIIYAILYRRHSSFARGSVITAIALAIFIAYLYNSADGFRAMGGEVANLGIITAGMIIFYILFTSAQAAGVYFSLVAGDGLWRSMGRKLWPRFREPGYGDHIWNSMKLSYLLALVLLGLQSAIFLVLQMSVGMWGTTDVTQSPLNTATLFIMPLLAWYAAIFEEAVFRLFSISLLKKWLKNSFIACLIPAFIWALGHVSYPIYPSTTRMIELTIIGVIFGYIMLKHGFITALFTHAILNTILMGLQLCLTGEAGHIIAALAYLVLPLAIAWIIRFWHGRKQAALPTPTLRPEAPQ